MRDSLTNLGLDFRGQATRDEDFDVLEQMALSLDDAATIRTFLTDTRKRNIRTSDAQRGLDWLKAREISDE